MNVAPPRPSEQEVANQIAPRVSTPAMPGPISGFGGGTFNLDGTAASPAQEQGGGRAIPPLVSAIPQGPLGGSMRQPFDYDAALARLAGEKPKIKDWQRIVAAIGDGLAAAGGGTPWATRTLIERQNDYAERAQRASEAIMGWRHQDWARQNEADLQAANPFTIGRDRLAYDPATGAVQTIYDGPEDFELYAAELGLEPGSDEYFRAVEDYVLRSSGPSAHDRDLEMDDHRTGNDVRLEALRQQNRASMEGVRQSNRESMEGVRQGNRLQLRRTPSARGGGASELPLVRTPAEAARLPKGTRFRTPSGAVKVVP